MDGCRANYIHTKSRLQAAGCTAIWSRLNNMFALCSRQGILLPLIKRFTLKRTVPGSMTILAQERSSCLSALSPGRMPSRIVSGQGDAYRRKRNGSMLHVVLKGISFPGEIRGKEEGAAVLMR